jgi:hypothetical protein
MANHTVPTCGGFFDVGAPEHSAEAILPQLIPEARGCNTRDGTLVVAPVLGGLTNKLFKVTFRERQDGSYCVYAASRSVLLRVYGAPSIDRCAETKRFIALAQAGLGPACYGSFENGRLEHFFEGFRTLSPQDLCDATRSRKIAEQLAFSHRAISVHKSVATPCTEYTGGGIGEGTDGGLEPSLWPQLGTWLEGARKAAFDEGSKEAAEYASINLTHVERHIQVARVL